MFIIMKYYIYYIIYVIDFSCLTFYLFRKNSVELLIDYYLKRELNRWHWLLIWVFSGISSISLISVLRWNWLYFLLTWFCVCVCLQDVLTDLSAECENLSVEGVSGTCYAHKVTKSLTSVSTLKSSKHQLWSMISLTVCWNVSLSQGISQAAHYIYKRLENDGILSQAFNIAPVRAVLLHFLHPAGESAAEWRLLLCLCAGV